MNTYDVGDEVDVISWSNASNTYARAWIVARAYGSVPGYERDWTSFLYAVRYDPAGPEKAAFLAKGEYEAKVPPARIRRRRAD